MAVAGSKTGDRDAQLRAKSVLRDTSIMRLPSREWGAITLPNESIIAVL